MTELKPCPFEKPGEKHHIEAIETHPGYGYIYCFDCEFAFPGEDEMPPDVLIERWNTRAERTCHPVRRSGKEFSEEDKNTTLEALCSECGDFLGEAQDVFSYDRDWFCSNCGAKVV